jgi:hypothetical protein
VQPRHSSIIVCAARVIVVGLALSISGVISLARIGRVPSVVEPPQSLLPGSKVPQDLQCNTPFDRRFRCHVTHNGEEVYWTADDGSHVIVHTTISAHQQTIGNLVAVWGAPTELTRSGQALYVFWGSRWAYLFACSLVRTTRVEFIGYGPVIYVLAEQRRLMWHGFTTDGDYGCSADLEKR